MAVVTFDTLKFVKTLEAAGVPPQQAEAMCASNAHLRWIQVADAGHYVHDDQPAAFERAVVAFLAEPERKPAA